MCTDFCNSLLLSAIIFCTSLVEYDLYLEEDPGVNRMQDSLNLFQVITTNKWLSQKPFILYLNKTDLLKKKIMHSPLTKCFPNYEGPNTYDAAIEHIQEALMRPLNQTVERTTDSYVHLTCAVDTRNIQSVFNITSELIMRDNYKHCGMF